MRKGGLRAARFGFICAVSVAVLCTTFPSPDALGAPVPPLLLAQAYQGPATGYPPPPAYSVRPQGERPEDRPPEDQPPMASLGATQGEIDGHADASTQISATAWFFVGFFLSWIGIILGYLLKPSVDGARLVGKSPDYVSAYTDAYQLDGRSFRGIHAVYGCVTSGAILLAVTVAFAALVAVVAGSGAE